MRLSISLRGGSRCNPGRSGWQSRGVIYRGDFISLPCTSFVTPAQSYIFPYLALPVFLHLPQHFLSMLIPSNIPISSIVLVLSFYSIYFAYLSIFFLSLMTLGSRMLLLLCILSPIFALFLRLLLRTITCFSSCLRLPPLLSPVSSVSSISKVMSPLLPYSGVPLFPAAHARVSCSYLTPLCPSDVLIVTCVSLAHATDLLPVSLVVSTLLATSPSTSSNASLL